MKEHTQQKAAPSRRRLITTFLAALTVLVGGVVLVDSPASANGVVQWPNGLTANTFAAMACYPETNQVGVPVVQASVIATSATTQWFQYDLYVSVDGGGFFNTVTSAWALLRNYGVQMNEVTALTAPGWPNGERLLNGYRGSHTYRYFFRYRWQVAGGSYMTADVWPKYVVVRTYPFTNTSNSDRCTLTGW